MDFEHYMSLSFRQGKEEGVKEKAIENARKLLADGKYTAEEISELFNIPVEDFAVNAEIKNPKEVSNRHLQY